MFLTVKNFIIETRESAPLYHQVSIRCRSEDDEKDSIPLQEALEPHYIH